MHQAISAKPRGRQLRQPILRTLTLFVVAVLVALTHTWINRDLQIAFDLRVENAGPYQLYLGDGTDSFSERQSFTHYARTADTWQRHVIDVRSIRRVNQIRLDPTTVKGAVAIGAIAFQSQWGSATLQGPSLQEAVGATTDLSSQVVEPEIIRWQATGVDPHIVVRIPNHVAYPSAAQLVPPALAAGLAMGALWLLLEIAAARLQHRQPRAHQTISTILVKSWLVPVLICLGMTWLASARISSAPILGDGVQNLLMAVNVFKHGTFSLDNSSTPKPTNFREPLDPLLVAAHLKLTVPEAVNRPFADFRAGDLTRTVKMSNLLWIFTGLLGIWALMLRLGGTNLAGFAASALSFQFFFHGGTYINTLYTELSTAALMIWASYGLLRSVQTKSLGWFFGSGVLLGLLGLSKASFVYIGLVAVPLLMTGLLFAQRPDRFRPARVMVWGLLMTSGFLLTLSPWLARNHAQFGSLRITERGGPVLWSRAKLNSMSNDEVLGLLHIHGPSLYRKAVAGTRLGEAPGDFERGGRWQRINRYKSSFWEADRAAAYTAQPDKAISFHYNLAAQYLYLVQERSRQGHPFPDQAVGDELQREAIALFKERPWRHIAMTAPFLWHGFWSFKKVEVPFVSLSVQDALGEILNLFSGIALFGVFFYGLLRRHAQWVAVTVLPVGLLMFYAFLSHNIPRYSTPAHPMMLLVLVLVARSLWQKLSQHRRRSHP